MIEDIKNRIKEQISKIEMGSNINDYVISVIKTDQIGNYRFKSNLEILPYELVENVGIKTFQDTNEYLKYFKPEFDPFYIDWSNNHERFWSDKLRLLELYTQVPEKPLSYQESFIRITELIKKIERRAILLTPEAKPVTQKQMRLSGEKKEYNVLRAYWIDDRGERKRIISRHIGEKHQNLERELASLLINRGYGVLWNYRSDTGNLYDMVIERDRMRSVVEIKKVTPELFDNLFLFDELLSRFIQDYPDEA